MGLFLNKIGLFIIIKNIFLNRIILALLQGIAFRYKQSSPNCNKNESIEIFLRQQKPQKTFRV
ncbi:hypothetical protein FPG102_04340 [Flavobacterium psychrophilum]|nr:hypothetical protein FPG102_04340 [Flavobacterium psychrophilum]